MTFTEVCDGITLAMQETSITLGIEAMIPPFDAYISLTKSNLLWDVLENNIWARGVPADDNVSKFRMYRHFCTRQDRAYVMVSYEFKDKVLPECEEHRVLREFVDPFYPVKGVSNGNLDSDSSDGACF